MDLLEKIYSKAKTTRKKIVLPEGTDPRTLVAAKSLQDNGFADVTVIHESNLNESFSTISTANGDLFDKAWKHFYQQRKHKGITEEAAQNEVKNNPVLFGACLVSLGVFDAGVAGAVTTTADVMRAGIFGIGLSKESDIVSSLFLMSLPDGRTFSYADCAVNPYPNAQQLASIAIDTAETHQKLTGEIPRVAFLSFSTKGSAKHERVDFVSEALQIAQSRRPDIMMDGEMQFDAALLPEIGKRKAPQSEVAGKANVFIFPNLDAGNIAYKITERLGGAIATGPIIQGLAKPFNDLSRGCSADDIVNTACVCAVLAQ